MLVFLHQLKRALFRKGFAHSIQFPETRTVDQSQVRHPAINDNLRSGNEPGFVRVEKQARICRVPAISHEAEWYAGESLLEQGIHVATAPLPGQPALDHRRMQLAG
jgi:hypothetical protein